MKNPTQLAILSLLFVAAAHAGEAPDLTGYYASPMGFGPPPQVLGPDGKTFVNSGVSQFPQDPYTRMNCIPDTAFGYNPYGAQLVQTPGRLTWINQYNQIVRRIDITDGKQTPPDNIEPSYTGYSQGHWEDDVLVVETTALRNVQVPGVPKGAQIKRIEERIRQLDSGAGLERTMRFEFVTPQGKDSAMTTRKVYSRDPKQHFYEFICEEAADQFQKFEDSGD